MSRLEELIAELCPDGVEYKKLRELFDTRNGYTPSKSNGSYWTNGTVPWFRMEDIRENGNILFDSLQHVTVNAVKGDLFPENSLIVATSATIGVHALITVPSLANQRFTYLILKDKWKDHFDIKFLFYYCFKLDEWCLDHLNQGNFASVDMKQFVSFRFPVPPLPVQQEVVRILDHFTELTAELQKQLEAELFARKKQYEVYSQRLLNRSEGNLYKLGEIATIKTGRKPDEVFLNSTDYEYINAGTSNSGFVTAANCEGDTTTTPSRGQGGIGFVGFQKKAFWLGPLCYRIKSTDTSVVTNRYIYYYLKCFPDLILQYKKEGGTPSVNASDLINIAIEAPAMDKQNRIVSILDQFESVCNDLSSGLPAEIAARQKQYEYYRDKLLTFKELQKS